MRMQHQTHNTTELNRYPDIFTFVSENYPNLQNILSFGCSSGEECFSLRNYFPNAHIFGVDIDQKVLDIARTKNTDNSISFTDSIDQIPKVDAIFAMSVFCRHPETSELDYNHIYNFSNFNTAMSLLDASLNSHGLLVIYNSNYLFLDTDVAVNYIPVVSDLREEFVRKFDKTGYHTITKSPLIFIKK